MHEIAILIPVMEKEFDDVRNGLRRARIWMRLRSAHFVLGLSTVCRETLHAVIENGSANCVASAGALLLCCSYCRTRYVRMSEPFNNTRN